jgi:hypothetical protein
LVLRSVFAVPFPPRFYFGQDRQQSHLVTPLQKRHYSLFDLAYASHAV